MTFSFSALTLGRIAGSLVPETRNRNPARCPRFATNPGLYHHNNRMSPGTQSFSNPPYTCPCPRGAGLVALLFMLIAATDVHAAIQLESPETQTALLELFTSEGCSSCPPAEKWFSGLAESPRLWKDFVPLAFHVDYWDRLGWKDPFASRAYSDRQRKYAASWRSGSIYTPGLVRNGEEWAGWHDGRELPGPSGTRVGILRANSDDLQHWRIDFVPSDGDLKAFQAHIAFLGFKLNSKVTAGENEGRTLNHDFVVLAFSRAPLSKSGAAFQGQVKLPSTAPPKGRTGVAIWVGADQNPKPLQALGGWLPSQGATRR